MDKTTRVLHISNTDIEFDSRILKELKAVGRLPGIQVEAVGVPKTNEAGHTVLDGAPYTKLHIASRGLRILPRAIRYFFQMIEFNFKVVVAGRSIRPDVVHCHDTFALPAGWILKRQLGCRIAYDAHELESDKNAQNAILSWSTLLIEKRCWKEVDLLISVSDSIIEWYAKNLGPKPSVLVLNSPVIAADVAAHPDAPQATNYLREKYGIPANHLVFIYLGMLGAGRGIEICLEAFAAGSREAHVVFMGSGVLEPIIAEYGRRHPNIHLHQAVPHDQVVSLVRSADYGLCLIEKVSLSDYYCLPNKLFEYCFARIPVLASDFPELRKVIAEYSLGVCCDPDPDSVRTALAQLTQRKPSRVTADITALSWEAQASRLATAYQERLMAPAGARPGPQA